MNAKQMPKKSQTIYQKMPDHIPNKCQTKYQTNAKQYTK